MAGRKNFPECLPKLRIIIAILAIILIVSFVDAASLRTIDLKDPNQESADADTGNEYSPNHWSNMSLPLDPFPNSTNQSDSTSSFAVVGLKKGTVVDVGSTNPPDMTTLSDGNKIIQDLSKIDESIFDEIAESESDTLIGKPPKIKINGSDEEEGGCPFFDETVKVITTDPEKILLYNIVYS